MSSNNSHRAELIDKLHQAGRQSSTATVMFHQAIAHRSGLNGTDHKCADLLRQMGPMTAGELAVLAGVTTGAITGVIDRLEGAGFVQRTKDPHDRRRVIIELKHNPALKARMEALFQPFVRAVTETASHYTDAQLEVIVDFMQRITAATRTETQKLRNDAVDATHTHTAS